MYRFICFLIVLLLFVVACANGGEDGGTTDGSESEGAVSPGTIVSQFYDALNTENKVQTSELWPDGDQLIEVLTDALHVKISATCRPGEDSNNSMQCDEDIGRHDFYSPAGIRGNITVEFTVEDEVIVERAVVSRSDEIDAFEADFGTWLSENYPDVYKDHYQGEGYTPFESAEGALAVIALVSEFLAQSDTYPLAE